VCGVLGSEPWWWVEGLRGVVRLNPKPWRPLCVCQCVSVTVGELGLGFLIGRTERERERRRNEAGPVKWIL
jgi:hypothetical protein